ncbi:hypothetical protein SFRURICE_005534, partial [Spodoptera frugiperda]
MDGLVRYGSVKRLHPCVYIISRAHIKQTKIDIQLSKATAMPIWKTAGSDTRMDLPCPRHTRRGFGCPEEGGILYSANNDGFFLNCEYLMYADDIQLYGTRKQVVAISLISADPEEKIERVERACSLGLTLDRELHFEAHELFLPAEYSIRNFLNILLRKQLVDCLILSKFNYCDTVYGPCLLARTD